MAPEVFGRPPGGGDRNPAGSSQLLPKKLIRKYAKV